MTPTPLSAADQQRLPLVRPVIGVLPMSAEELRQRMDRRCSKCGCTALFCSCKRALQQRREATQ